jgi:hypothetical protein
VAIRAILSPYHLRNGKLVRSAFSSPSNRDEVSTSRQPYVPPTVAKMWAKLFVQRLHDATPKRYMGLAFVDVSRIRGAGSDVVDTRGEYLGHADIQHGIVVLKGEPLPPQQKLMLDKRLDVIVAAARYVRDKAPDSITWR